MIESVLATNLRTTVVESLENIAKQHPVPGEDRDEHRNWLQECKQAILDGNHIYYHEALSGLVGVVLAKLRSTLVRELKLTRHRKGRGEPHEPHLVLLSFHVSSIQLRKWFRVLHPRTAWSQTDYRGSEISFFEAIYDWDSRYGHILTDPEMPQALDVTFGAPVDRLPRWNGRDPACSFCLSSDIWQIAHDLVASPVWSLLVNHELDKCRTQAQVKRALKRYRHFLQNDIDSFAANLHALAAKVKGLWPTTDKTPMALRARSFLLSFFYTVGRKPKVRCERIVASSAMPACSRSSGTRLVKTGSLAVVIAGERPASVRAVQISWDDIQPANDVLANAIVELEHRALFERLHEGLVSITEEDAIRQACEVDYLPETDRTVDKPGFEQLLRLTRPLHEAIAHSLVERHYLNKETATRISRVCTDTSPGNPITLPAELKQDTTTKKLLEDCDIVGASRQYVQLVRDLAAAAGTDDLTETRVVFLDSEPGCGKEMLAKLFHLFSIRAHLDSHAAITFSDGNETLHSVFKKRKRSAFRTSKRDFLEKHLCPDHETSTVNAVLRAYSKETKSAVYSQARLFNYFTLNMAALTNEERFFSGLFGKYEKEKLTATGVCLLAHGLSGTVFLDEFNTLPAKQFANVFLRLIEKPFEMEIIGRPGGALQNTNMLVICASNKAREELIEAGFNEAVVYRFTKTRLRIPPLRERPTDIAIFVNACIRKHNEKRCKAKKRNEQIRRIDIQAIRLLCELRWPDNYRGIQGLVADILGARIRRGIEHPELTFDEILRGLRRREAFQAAISRGKTEVIQHATKN